MDFAEWEPVYQEILADFGYSRTGDEQARDVLVELFEDGVPGDAEKSVTETLSELDFSNETVAVVGGAPTLDDDIGVLDSATAIVAASNAAQKLRERGYSVDCMVTDLDKTPATAQELTHEETPVAVHAHGDNIELLEQNVPKFDCEWVIPTTQARPTGPVCNFGGFTDGDRAAFLADELGATRLRFAGWAFDDETLTEEKARKLDWAGRLLHWLERHRDEEFAILDGRRDEYGLV
jgi:uncharacterized Rossmann fold enzyme